MKKYLLILAFMTPMVANAGIIASDGNEWELRGPLTNVAGHTAQAAADTGWLWASLTNWRAAQLNFRQFSGAELDAFEGACDGTRRACGGYLSSSPAPANFDVIVCFRCGEFTGADVGSFLFGTRTLGVDSDFRVSFRPQVSAVPDPASSTLLGLSLVGLALTRRRVKR